MMKIALLFAGLVGIALAQDVLVEPIADAIEAVEDLDLEIVEDAVDEVAQPLEVEDEEEVAEDEEEVAELEEGQDELAEPIEDAEPIEEVEAAETEEVTEEVVEPEEELVVDETEVDVEADDEEVEVDVEADDEEVEGAEARELWKKRRHYGGKGRYSAPTYSKKSFAPVYNKKVYRAPVYSKAPVTNYGKKGRWLEAEARELFKKRRRSHGKYQPTRTYNKKSYAPVYNKKTYRAPVVTSKKAPVVNYGKKGYGRWLGRKYRKHASYGGKYAPRTYSKKAYAPAPVYRKKTYTPVVTKKAPAPVYSKGKGAFGRWLGKKRRGGFYGYGKASPVTRTYNKKAYIPTPIAKKHSPPPARISKHPVHTGKKY